MPCQQYFSHVEPSPREMKKEECIDNRKAPSQELASSEAITFLSEASGGSANPLNSFSNSMYYSLNQKISNIP